MPVGRTFVLGKSKLVWNTFGGVRYGEGRIVQLGYQEKEEMIEGVRCCSISSYVGYGKRNTRAFERVGNDFVKLKNSLSCLVSF